MGWRRIDEHSRWQNPTSLSNVAGMKLGTACVNRAWGGVGRRERRPRPSTYVEPTHLAKKVERRHLPARHITSAHTYTSPLLLFASWC